MSPLFVHDPRRGTTLAERFSLEGNPEPDGLWITTTLTYRDSRKRLQAMTMPLTPADFAIGEQRFARQFRWLAAYEEDVAVPIAEYVELPQAQRAGRIPFVFTTDSQQRLVKMACSTTIVSLVEDRRRHWRTLQFLAGRAQAALTAQHRAEVEGWVARYGEAVDARESALDLIAQAMADLATSSEAPAATAVADRPIWLDPDDLGKCNDCATCYQELPQLFEKATIVADGVQRTVGRMKPGSLDGLEVTPELATRIARVKATCDAEIIQ
jgi:pyruvate-ferredoxin/flavodoxin oxidoreductase